MIIFLTSISRPLLLSMLRANHVTASVILTAFAASLAHVVILELANSLVDVYFTQVGGQPDTYISK